jgi:hypothetical protein
VDECGQRRDRSGRKRRTRVRKWRGGGRQKFSLSCRLPTGCLALRLSELRGLSDDLFRRRRAGLARKHNVQAVARLEVIPKSVFPRSAGKEESQHMLDTPSVERDIRMLAITNQTLVGRSIQVSGPVATPGGWVAEADVAVRARVRSSAGTRRVEIGSKFCSGDSD